jgi:hypothetical protein
VDNNQQEEVSLVDNHPRYMVVSLEASRRLTVSKAKLVGLVQEGVWCKEIKDKNNF